MGLNNLSDRQIKFARKLEIAFVVCRHGLDRAGAVAEQNVVGDPNRSFFFVRRIDRVSAGEDAGFFFRELGPLEIAFARSFFPILANGRPLLFRHDEVDQGMLRCEHHIGRAIKRVGSRGENAYPRVVIVDLEIDFRAFAAADPVSL